MNHLAQTSPFPVNLQVEKAKGIYLYTNNGEKFMDLISGVGVNNIGHCDKRVIKAIQRQSKKHLHVMVFGEYLQPVQQLFAKKLSVFFPDKLNTSYFTNSGAEAIEAALKLAKRSTGRTEFISLEKSYHGSTHGALSVTGNEEKKYAYRPFLPGVKFISQNSFEDIQKINSKTAAIILEIIQGDAGVRLSEQKWLTAVQKKCKETGTLIIVDEIQTGFGRTGKMFAFQHYNFEPDIVCIGKAMAGGMHMGGLVCSRKLMTHFTKNPILGHITTFGGHPISCAAGIANLDILSDENWIGKSEQKADYIFKKLSKHKAIKAIRYKGLFFAIDLKNDKILSAFLDHLKDTEKALAFRFLSAPYSFRLAPPLCITQTQIEIACEKILRSLDAVSA
jgi:acetylornithine/succinyldiaminopimelate/putrescine aminotransferase